MKRRISLAATVLVVILSGCQKTPPPQEGIWNGTITLADQKQLPFQAYLNLAPAASSGYFVNGNEKTPIPELYMRGDSLEIHISEYGAAMRALWDGKKYAGEFLRFRKDTTSNAFQLAPAVPVVHADKKAAGWGSLVGKFQVYFDTEKGIDSSYVATFWTRGDSVFGTLVEPSGDLGLMAGTQSGDAVRMGRFTGWQAQLIELTRKEDRWTGTLAYRTPPVASLELIPRPNVSFEVPEGRRTTVKDKRKAFAFSGVGMFGDTVTSADLRFKGKAIIVDIMGTWCHNCMDAAPLLQRMYSDFYSQGLEVVSLAFEITDNLELARKNLLLFQERYGISFTVLFCGSTSKSNVDLVLRSQLNNFSAYPTALFIDRKGVVQYIHEGFKGPGTGEEYQRQVELYYALTRKLLGTKSASR